MKTHETMPPKDEKPDAPAWYCIPLAIPQLGHFQSTFCADARQLDKLLARREEA